MNPPEQDLGPISPFFIVENVPKAVEFYVKHLAFELRLLLPEDDPFFAIVGRGAAQILLKSVSPDVRSQPNPTRHRDAPWDAFLFAADPDALASEFEGSGVAFHAPLGNRDDGLRGFELRDEDGYVLFFGRPYVEPS